MPFVDQHDQALLRAAGYKLTHVPASWEDVGDPENGPKLAGGPAYDLWELQVDTCHIHYVIVLRGEVVEHDISYEPPNSPF